MDVGRRGRPRALALLAAAAAVVLTGCSNNMTNGSGHTNSDDGSAMMGRGSGYHSSSRTCMPPTTLPGTLVQVRLGDMGMKTMMGGVAPMGARMRLRSSTTHTAAGTVTLVVSNLGWRTHELVVLPLAQGVAAGRRVVGPRGRVSEAGSLGEASRSCGPGPGEGITAGSAGWTTLTLPAGRYELVCNLRNHYANGMRQALTVS